MQLDLFEHGRDVMLRNDALQALQRRDGAAARQARGALAAEFPDDASLPLLDRLMATLQEAAPPFADHAEAQAAVNHLRDHVEPAARQLFGDREAGAWLVPQWRQAAQRAARLAFEREHDETHAAPLWLRAGDHAAAAAAVARIESWHRIPAPLQWAAEARWYLQGVDTCWGLLAELAWLAPARFDRLAQRLPDPLLRRLRRQFDAEFEGDGSAPDLAWLPAWLLTEKPALAAALGTARAGMHSAPERAMRLLLDLLHLARDGRQRELVAQRRASRDLHPSLYAAYMRTR